MNTSQVSRRHVLKGLLSAPLVFASGCSTFNDVVSFGHYRVDMESTEPKPFELGAEVKEPWGCTDMRQRGNYDASC